MITLKSKQEVEIMRQGGRILAETLQEVAKIVQPGISAFELDKLARELVFSKNAKPAFLNYKPDGERPYPAALCVSVNDEVVHGLPIRKKVLRDGDIVKLDLGVEYQNLFTDAAIMVPVGEISEVAKRVIEVTRECLDLGIAEIAPGKMLNDYAEAVEKNAERNGFSVVRDLVGHGVGHKVHEPPQILNYRSRLGKVVLEEGMTLALEPMVNEGMWEVNLSGDGWTFRTRDGKLNGHWEHTVAVTNNGCEVLTKI